MSDIALHWIGGQWRGSPDSSMSSDPATGDQVGRYADGGATEAEAAIVAARQAFHTSPWARDRGLRQRVLLDLAAAFDAAADDIATMITRETGKTLRESSFEAGSLSGTLRHAAGMTVTQTGISAEANPGTYFTTLAEPAGVVGVIVPWNAPAALFIRSLAPALAAGNTVVTKLPGQTAMTNALLSATIASVTALPAGTVNIFTESGNTGAPALVASPEVDIISYTGSVGVGRAVAAAAAASLKRVNLELGGKTPLLVFADANLDEAVRALTMAVTFNAGQFCMAGTRILVHHDIADTLRERLATSLSAVAVGPGSDPSNQMGALIDKAAVDRVDAFVEDSLAYATPIVRGGPARNGELANGSFYRPSLLEVQDVTTPLVQEELFAPVATFEVFDEESDAIERANATSFGLAAAVFTTDGARARRVSRGIAAGTVWHNTYFALDDGFAEGGYKHSGVGRLRGPFGLAEFQEFKTYVEATTR